jgi:hypothetical protein
MDFHRAPPPMRSILSSDRWHIGARPSGPASRNPLAGLVQSAIHWQVAH